MTFAHEHIDAHTLIVRDSCHAHKNNIREIEVLMLQIIALTKSNPTAIGHGIPFKWYLSVQACRKYVLQMRVLRESKRQIPV